MKPTASARMPERAQLAAVIERHHEAAAQLERIEQAIVKIADGRVADRTSIGRARQALKVADAGRSEILISQALGESAPDLPSPAEAKALLDECEARLDAGRAALNTLESEADRARSALWLLDVTLNRAVDDVVAADPALALLRAEFAACVARMSSLLGALLGAGHAVSLVGWGEPAFVPAPDWVKAREALRTDPDLVLPSPPDAPSDARGRRAA